MTLKPVAFKKDIQHTNLSFQTRRSSVPRAPLKKPMRMRFSDSESDNDFDNPIPFLKNSSSSESFSDEDHDINIKPTQIRKGYRRPMPINRVPKPPTQSSSNTNTQKESTTAVPSQKFLPHPPNSIKSNASPPNDDKKVSPMFFRRMKKNASDDENVKNWATPQKQISLIKPKMDQRASSSYSEQSYNTSNDSYSNDETSKSQSPRQTPQKTESPKQSPSSKSENGNTSHTEIDTNLTPDSDNNTSNKDTDEIKKALNTQINNILNSNTPNEQSNDQIPSSPTHTDDQQNTEESTEPPQSICYYMDRKIVSKFTKNKLCMSLTRGSFSIISQSFDVRDESFQITYANQRYTILMESTQCSFSLRRGESYGDEIFSILYNTTKNAIRPKNCVLHFFVKVQGLPNRLQSVQPESTIDGEAKISFDHRQVIPSVKNMKFLDENKKEVLAVMKIGKDQICIEALSNFPEVIIYTIGIAAFLNHSK